jgi:hypothetical protein
MAWLDNRRDQVADKNRIAILEEALGTLINSSDEYVNVGSDKFGLERMVQNVRRDLDIARKALGWRQS